MQRNIFIYSCIFIIYVVTAIHSNGYHHPDEHFQLIEFAGLIDGWNTGFDLAWEYDAQIRPVLQPAIAFSVFSLLNLLGINDPFLLMTILRLLTAFLSLYCIGIFVRSFSPLVKDSYRMVFTVCSFLLWFLPAVNVRFSSESWAGLMFLLAVAIIYSTKDRNFVAFTYMKAGVLLGLSFVFRFQMAVAVSGLLSWLIFVRKDKISNLLYIVLGAVSVIVLGVLLDSWFYGNWVFTPWNYFRVNIISDVASLFGVSSRYHYLREIIVRPTMLIGIFIFLSLFILLLFDYKNILLWCLIPFLLVHSLIPHKELRFLFPIVNFIPLVMTLAYQKINSLLEDRQLIKAVFYPLLGLMILINTGGVIMMSFKPAMYGNVNIMKYINDHCDTPVNIYTIAWSNPYSEGPYKGLNARFYRNPNVKICDLSEVLHHIFRKKLLDGDMIILQAGYSERVQVEALGFTVRTQSIPRWIEKMNWFYQVYPQDKTLLLYTKHRQSEI